MKTRVATLEDIAGIYAIEESSFSKPWSLESMSNDLSNPIATYLVVEEDHEIRGYVGVWNVMSEGQITNVAVAASHREKGVGSKLIKALVDYAKENQLVLLLLEVRSSNIAAQKLYSKFGFEQLAVRKGYYSHPKEDALIMGLKLEEIGI